VYVRSEVIFDAGELTNRLRTLEERMAVPSFWDNNEAAQEVIQEVKTLRGWLDPYREIESKLRDLEEFGALLETDSDEALEAEWARELGALDVAIERLELRNMLRGKDDERDALLTIHPGAGGTESQDWAEMLMRMYSRWAEKGGFGVTVLDLQPGEEAGIKSVTLEVKGQYAYGYLKAEKGVHRLVRISPFDSQARRHTSFASVFVYPDIEDEIDIEINDDDLRIDTFRSSGAGGQHVNKTSSAVRVTHLPTGIAVACQQERSQHKNKATAMKMLKAALYELEEQKRQAERDKVEATKTDIAWGNQIRSYVFQPYTMVNDHRTDLKISDVQGVMNGALDPFIEAYLKEHGGRAG
jgi:peptide chain release factor 2